LRKLILYFCLALAAIVLLRLPAQGFPSRSAPVLPIARTDGAPSLAEQGKAFYDAGQYIAAIRVLRQALDSPAQAGDSLRQAMLWGNLSLNYQQLGQWPEATQSIDKALALLQSDRDRLGDGDVGQVMAQTLDIQGRLQFSLSKPEAALKTWEQSAALYTQLKDSTGVVRARINQSKALQALGLYRRALAILSEVQDMLQSQPDSVTKLAGLRSLGEILQATGDLKKSNLILEQSLALAQRLQLQSEVSHTFLSLGNTARAQERLQKALSYYQEATAAAPSAAYRVRSQLHQLSLLAQLKQPDEAQALLPKIQEQIEQLPLSRTQVNARIYLAQSVLKLDSSNPSANTGFALAKTSLEIAVQDAKRLEDARSQVYALGTLGELYEKTQQIPQAQTITQQALLLAQPLNANDLAYRFQWQSGRLYKQQGNVKQAIAAYGEAVKALQSIQRDLTAINKDLQFSFRDSVEPVYRDYVELLLQPDGAQSPSQQNLKTARETIDALQVAEIANFLRVSCLDNTQVLIDEVADKEDPNAAILYPILLGDRVAIILKKPQQQNLSYYATPIAQDKVEATLENLRKALSQSNSQEVLAPAQATYNWLIRPIESELDSGTIKTLVFVLDGSLRNIPMSVLHDGRQYLVEKPYSIALTPGLRLLQPKPLQQQKLKALVAGLSESPLPEFSPLPFVGTELKQIESQLPSVELINQAFTPEAFQSKIDSQALPIVHLATHGQFSSNPEQTFILTWSRRLTVNQLASLLETSDRRKSTPIELLVLSACETIAGDRRAALGLAGVAVKAGARSTLATLWQINDESTAIFMEAFYHELVQKGVSKAEALSNAQRHLFKNANFRHPYYWAPYVLLGNWL
jgi:CHAT domain-containing protein/lipopolysaccharide biosynthesis regulator YciM